MFDSVERRMSYFADRSKNPAGLYGAMHLGRQLSYIEVGSLFIVFFLCVLPQLPVPVVALLIALAGWAVKEMELPAKEVTEVVATPAAKPAPVNFHKSISAPCMGAHRADAGVLVATRVHRGNANALDLTKVTAFVSNAAAYASRVAIAVGVPEAEGEPDALSRLVADVQGAAKAAGVEVPVEVIPVSPWGKFTPALNAIVAHAARTGVDQLLLQSVEVEVDRPAVKQLQEHLTPDRCVVGAALPGHAFAGCTEVALRGDTCPWNTLALWSVPTLALTSFPSVGDGLLDDSSAGVEEVSAVAVLQRLVPHKAGAAVVQVPGLDWVTHFEDARRAEWHSRKMASKVTRPASHLAALGLSGSVTHLPSLVV
jgi:hypothetical protein